MLFMAPDSSKLHRLLGVFVSDRELARLVHYWKGTHVVDDTSRYPAGAPYSASQASTAPQKPGARSEETVQPIQQPLWSDFKANVEEMAHEDEDDLLSRAVEVVRSHNRASVSLLQRRLRIGYARAARLIDMMEEQGIIGPDEGGGRSRQILLDRPDAEV
jgi:S-DNA-T family DNA segregation ATPase FtsK/SpoIIIE